MITIKQITDECDLIAVRSISPETYKVAIDEIVYEMKEKTWDDIPPYSSGEIQAYKVKLPSGLYYLIMYQDDSKLYKDSELYKASSTHSNLTKIVTKDISANRYHDICCGHRVVGHEGKCKNLHGHNYRFHFSVKTPHLDSIGRTLDFTVIKEKLCEWLEQNYDHKMLIWIEDPLLPELKKLDSSIVAVPFNPTAENIAIHIVETVAPFCLINTGAVLTKCTIEETRKCSVTYEI